MSLFDLDPDAFHCADDGNSRLFLIQGQLMAPGHDPSAQLIAADTEMSAWEAFEANVRWADGIGYIDDAPVKALSSEQISSERMRDGLYLGGGMRLTPDGSLESVSWTSKNREG